MNQENGGANSPPQPPDPTGEPASPAPTGYIPRSGRRGLGGAIFGIWIVLIGVLFLLQNLGYFYIGQVWQLWPVILIGVGVSRLLCRGRAHSRLWGLFTAGIGCVFLLSNLGYITPHIWRYVWPFALIVWGLMMMAGGPFRGSARFDHFDRARWERKQARRQYRDWNRGFSNMPPPWVAPTGAAIGAGIPAGGSAGGFAAYTSSAANRLHEYAILGGVRRRIDSQEFEGGEATAVMGGVELDLTGAGTKLDEVVIEANALMGGVEIRVPQDWEVVVQGVGILGGYDDSTHGAVNPVTAPDVKRPRLIITGQALFGGVHVRN